MSTFTHRIDGETVAGAHSFDGVDPASGAAEELCELQVVNVARG